MHLNNVQMSHNLSYGDLNSVYLVTLLIFF
jgi:hypothetical protein